MAPVELEIGQTSDPIQVRSKRRFDCSGLRVVAGGRYRVDIGSDQEWSDSSITCGPGGWLASEELKAPRRQIVEALESIRRVPEANWFELIATVGHGLDEVHRIGTGGDEHAFTARGDGDLYFFANDMWLFYFNNKGSIQVTVTRLA